MREREGESERAKVGGGGREKERERERERERALRERRRDARHDVFAHAFPHLLSDGAAQAIFCFFFVTLKPRVE